MTPVGPFTFINFNYKCFDKKMRKSQYNHSSTKDAIKQPDDGVTEPYYVEPLHTRKIPILINQEF